jgi:DNA replication ATP-dependent helicase Dna2
MMDTKSLAGLVYDRLEKLRLLEEETGLTELRKLFIYLIDKISDEEAVHFTSLFSKCAYLSQRYDLSPNEKRGLHLFRKHYEQKQPYKENSNIFRLGEYALVALIRNWSGVQPNEALEFEGTLLKAVEKSQDLGFRVIVEGVGLEWQGAGKRLLFIDDELPEREVCVMLDSPEKNDSFQHEVRFLAQNGLFPVRMNLLDVEIGKDGVYRPAGVVIYPDYLLDVTSIAECFQPDGINTAGYLLRKLLPASKSYYLLRGSIVNWILDELVNDPNWDFDTHLEDIFKLSPLHFSILDDDQVRKLIRELRLHCGHLKDTLKNDLPERRISVDKIYLEPAYFSPEYGVQGRLDILHMDREKRKADIVELKSGKPFRSNKYGLNSSHYIQTLLYDMLIRSAYRGAYKPQCYILYSVKENDRMCFAPPIRGQQLEAIHVRNGLVSMERQLAGLSSDFGPFQDMLRRVLDRPMTGFLAADCDIFMRTLTSLDDIERAYYTTFVGFLAREQWQAKVGGINKAGRMGFAALWNEPQAAKDSCFQIMRALTIFENKADHTEPFIVFNKEVETNPLANFREGDIVVLYPMRIEHRPTGEQCIRGKIIELGEDKVTVALRSMQRNKEIFVEYRQWNLEKDFLDSSFRSLFGSLFAFISGPKEVRDKWLGRTPPSIPVENDNWAVPGHLTSQQADILRKMLNSRDYFLLWGPPGTGKTSVMLKSYVERIVSQTEESVLILSYTNRAVDEICEVLSGSSYKEAKDYIRIGSRYSTGIKYRAHLLSNKLKTAERRSHIKFMLLENRVTVGTVASVLSNGELIGLKQYDRVVVDEASQMLDPHLIGLLSKFSNVVMIGDHKQLPAVVVQNATQSRIRHKGLNGLGITDASESLFERMFKHACENEWTHAYALLKKQGRMHQDIMRFVSIHFYAGSLELLGLSSDADRLRSRIPSFIQKYDPERKKFESSSRVEFLFTKGYESLGLNKVNEAEAKACVDWIQRLFGRNGYNAHNISSQLIGIITPFRAQIAQIRQALTDTFGHEVLRKITIDTVERYQGGARDIIMISPVANNEELLNLGSAHNYEGVDRKLNVALSRAREYVVIVGDSEVLLKKKEYADLYTYTRSLSSYKSSSSLEIRNW